MRGLPFIVGKPRAHTPLRVLHHPTLPPLTSSSQWKMFKNPIFTKQTFCKSFSPSSSP